MIPNDTGHINGQAPRSIPFLSADMEVLDNGYRLTWEGANISAVVSRLAYSGQDAVNSTVAVYVNDVMIAFDLAMRISDMAAPGRVAGAIKNLLPEHLAHWAEPIGFQVTKRPLMAFLTGQNLADEVKVPGTPLPPAVPWLVRPLIVGEGVSILFGNPGSGKSLLSCAAGLSAATGATVCGLEYEPVRTVKVLYLDFEASERGWRQRMDGLALGHGLIADEHLGFHYLNISGHIATVADKLRRLVAEGEYGLVIVDSAGRIAGDATTPTDSTKAMQVLASLEVPSLLIAHNPKNATGSIYGSRFWEAGARLVTRLDGDHENGQLKHSYTTTKANDVAWGKATTVEYTFESPDGPNHPISAVFYGGSVSTKPTSADLVKGIMEEGPATYTDLADALSLSERQVMRTVKDLIAKGELVVAGKRGASKLFALAGSMGDTLPMDYDTNHDITET